MRLKQLLLLTLLPAAGLLFSSCNKWLDISPKTQVKEDDQFSSREGFIDALFGVYQQAASPSTYGQNLSYGFLDVLAQRYENKTNLASSWYAQAARYNYTFTGGGVLPVRNTIDNIWSNMYKTISNANFILKNTEKHKDVLPGIYYGIVKGEAMAIRAFVHFDLVRLFAPAYLNGDNATAAAIPYMDVFTVLPKEKLTLAAVLDKCEAELKQAETLLSVHTEIDQIAGNQGVSSIELALMYRQNHLNYWAVKAMLARLYLYKGNKPLALKYATEVIDSKKFRFITQQELNVDALGLTSDMTFSSEHIFSIFVSGLKTQVDDILKNAEVTGGDPTDFFTTKVILDRMYEVTLPGYGNETRGPAASKSLWNQLSATVVYSKKLYSDNATNVKQRMIPVLRLPEMYYIAAEAAPTLAEGVAYLNVVRLARLLPELPVPATADLLDAEILKEYRKEFVGEGQLWFYYKRKNTVTIPEGVGNPMTPAKYLFPLPLAEIEYGK